MKVSLPELMGQISTALAREKAGHDKMKETRQMAGAAAAKKTAYPAPHHARIDEMLARAGDLTLRVRAVESRCQAELDALTAKHKKTIGPIKQELETLDNSIQDYTRTHQVDLFEGRDRIDLANGALLHQFERD